MNRRVILLPLLALAACLGLVGFPSTADAQQPASPRHVAVLSGAGSLTEEMVQAFRQGLAESGYVEGRDVVIEWRSANGDYARVSSNCLEGGASVIYGERQVGPSVIWPPSHAVARDAGSGHAGFEWV